MFDLGVNQATHQWFYVKRAKRQVTTPQQGTWDIFFTLWFQPPSTIPYHIRPAEPPTILSPASRPWHSCSIPSSWRDLLPISWLENSHSPFQSQLKWHLLPKVLCDFPEGGEALPQPFAYIYVLVSIRWQYRLISCYLSLRLDLEKLVFNCKLRRFLLGKLATIYSFWIPPA